MANDIATSRPAAADVQRAQIGATATDPSPLGGSAQLQVSLSIRPARDGGERAFVVATGEVDVASVGLLRTAVLAVAAAPRPRGQAFALVLDWQGVTFLDSGGVYLLSELHAKAAESGWFLRWIPPKAAGPARLLRLAADQGWAPWQVVPLPASRYPDARSG